MTDYNFNDLVKTYKSVGLIPGKVVYVTGNFGRLGRYTSTSKKTIFKDHLDAMQSIIGDAGTIIVPSHSRSLCNTNHVFDLNETPSETGPFTEFVRQQENSIRQIHPFSSSTALGAKAVEICTKNSLHAYGPESPFQRMIEHDALYVSVGQSMEGSISLIHHIELVMGVPYRYTKEFIQPCICDNVVKLREFYLSVTRNDVDINRDYNKKIMAHYRSIHKVKSERLGRSFVESLSSYDFYHSIAKLFAKDIYVWLENPPKDRAYRH